METPIPPLLFLLGVAAVAATMRAPLTGVGPLIPSIQADTGISSTAAGFLGTLPLLAFAGTSPFVRSASQRVGTRRALIGALSVVAVGTLVRSLPGIGFLFAGTVLLAIGIAFCNVLLPSIIKATVPAERIGRVTGFYVTVMGLLAAIASGVAVPIGDALDGSWRASLAVWALPAVIALVLSVASRFAARANRPPAAGAHSPRSVWSSKLAWQVSIFMGLQSIVFYAVISWLPSIVAERGVGEQIAGWQLTAFQVAGLITSTAVPILTRRLPDQSAVAVIASLTCGAGLAVLLLFPSMSWLAVTLIGLGGGASLVLALSFQSLRAHDAASAGALAGMAQTVGYLLAAAAPLALGLLRDLSGSWRLSLTVMVTLTMVQAVFGHRAGRDRHLSPPIDAEHLPTKGTPA
ncbi:CynX/NimT family MFS transporter [Rhodococcus sp. MEB064]|uniref:CynX/NimT family MFS transporter n=1 Tax=Rhodococcus sp. MEB064 TaxID=1587522 RepID=UPI0006974C78|nr:MFS transporter [Rhodococcus sp. MEB064]